MARRAARLTKRQRRDVELYGTTGTQRPRTLTRMVVPQAPPKEKPIPEGQVRCKNCKLEADAKVVFVLHLIEPELTCSENENDDDDDDDAVIPNPEVGKVVEIGWLCPVCLSAPTAIGAATRALRWPQLVSGDRRRPRMFGRFRVRDARAGKSGRGGGARARVGLARTALRAGPGRRGIDRKRGARGVHVRFQTRQRQYGPLPASVKPKPSHRSVERRKMRGGGGRRG